MGILFPAQVSAQRLHGPDPDSLRHIINHSKDIKARLDAANIFLLYLFNTQQYDSAAYYGDLFYPEAERAGHTRVMLKIQFQRAAMLNNKGKPDSAIRLIEKSQQLAIATKDTGNLCQILDFLSNAYYRQANIDGVKDIYRQSLHLSKHAMGRILIVRQACKLANLLHETGMHDSAIALFTRTESLGRQCPGNIYFELVSGLGAAQATKGDFKGAFKNLSRALAFYEGAKLEKSAVALKIEMGRFYTKQNRPKMAIPFFEAALRYGNRNNDYDVLRETLPSFAAALANLDQWQEAYKYLDQSRTLEDSLHTNQNKTAVASLQTRFESALKEKENQVLSLQLENRKTVIARQRWMISSVIGLLLLSGLGYWLYLRYRRQRWQQEMEQKKAESELLNLKSQFDPHFIHNFFAFLVKQVKEGAREKSVSLLNECSRYFRNILEQNRENIISLEEEIEGLTRYLNLQQQIHEGKFEYSIEADEKLDTFGIELPALLFQPFVENALKHGFGNIDYKGKLEIKFSADDQYLEGIVADNGPGPGTSKANAPEHKSVGTQLTHERLDLFTNLKKLGKGWIESGARKDVPGYFVRVKLPLV